MLYPAELRAPLLCYIGAMRTAARLLAALALLGAQAQAAPPAVTGIGAGLALQLSDGATALPAGIRVPDCAAPGGVDGPWCRRAIAILRQQLAQGRAVVTVAVEDRWRRRFVAVRGADQRDLAGLLVGEGVALVDPLATTPDHARALLAAERGARGAGRGIWGMPLSGVQAAETVRAVPVRYAVVRGTVRRAASTRYWVYLNFGRDRRRDFTLRLAPALGGRLRGTELDPLRLEGRNLLVRGWIFAAGGPMMEIVDPIQIELLP